MRLRDFLQAIGLISSATLVSRVLGYLRDMLIAHYLGAGWVADAFFVAHRIPNFLRRLFGEGTLTAAFVPVLAERLATEGDEAARRLIGRLASLLLAASTALTVLGVLAAPWLVRIMAPGFIHHAEEFALAVNLTRVMFPFALFLAVAALAMGILQTHKRFLWPALAPAAYNLCIIVVTVALADRWWSPAYALAAGVVVGGLAQLVIQLPAVRALNYPLRLVWRPGDRAVLRVVRLMGPGILALAILQVNVLISTLLASFLPVGAVSYLYYANRITEFPLGLFGISVATASLPALSDYVAQGDREGFVRGVRHALQIVFLAMVPAAVGMIALADPIITLLFQTGAFTGADVEATRLALFGFAAGIWAYATVKVVIQAFYAHQDTTTPLRTGAAAVVVNIALSLALMVPLRHAGLALATSLAAIFQFGLLLYLLRRRIGLLGGRRLIATAGRAVAASAVMGLSAVAAHRWWTANLGGSRFDSLVELAVVIPAAMVVYGVALLALRGEESRWVVQRLRSIFSPA
jgi:putative peptidoglycan lipid II flippase